MKETPKPKPRADGHKTGLSGEFFVAAELLKRGLQTSLTLGNAKAIDLFAINDKGKQFAIQVKALRSRNHFPLDPTKIVPDSIYVFVVLNKLGVSPDYYIVPGADFHSKPDRFGKWFHGYEKFPGVHPNDLTEYRDGWQLFDVDKTLGLETPLA
jgi:hypothetical protein